MSRSRWKRGPILWHADKTHPELFAAMAVGAAHWDWHLQQFGRSLRIAPDESAAQISAILGRIDGPRGMMALAGFPNPDNPSISGKIAFDAADFFELCQEGRAEVATHEIGHALGLQHSENRQAIMFPTYRGPHNGRLNRADVMALKKLYR